MHHIRRHLRQLPSMPSTRLLGKQVKGDLYKERIETPKRYAVSTHQDFPLLLPSPSDLVQEQRRRTSGAVRSELGAKPNTTDHNQNPPQRFIVLLIMQNRA